MNRGTFGLCFSGEHHDDVWCCQGTITRYPHSSLQQALAKLKPATVPPTMYMQERQSTKQDAKTSVHIHTFKYVLTVSSKRSWLCQSVLTCKSSTRMVGQISCISDGVTIWHSTPNVLEKKEKKSSHYFLLQYSRCPFCKLWAKCCFIRSIILNNNQRVVSSYATSLMVVFVVLCTVCVCVCVHVCVCMCVFTSIVCMYSQFSLGLFHQYQEAAINITKIEDKKY